MSIYETAKKTASTFLSSTSLTVDEFDHLLPVFTEEYKKEINKNKNRQRREGGGRKSQIPSMEDKLFFILYYHKLYPLQTALGLQFSLSQSQVNYWIHLLIPVLRDALGILNQLPLRNGSEVATQNASPGETVFLIDATERPMQRPCNNEEQKAKYSGKKKTTRIRIS